MSQRQNRQMNRTGTSLRHVARALPALLLVCAPLLVSEAQAATIAAPAPEITIEGVWMLTTTLRDCSSDSNVETPFLSLVTFAPGGATFESSGSTLFGPGQLSPEHGTHTRVSRSTYEQRMTALILYATPPESARPTIVPGWMKSTQTVVPVETEKLVSKGKVEFYASSGKRYRTLCSTANGSRIR